MDRRVLVVFIAIMSALVVLLMVHFNQPALAPTPEPIAQDNSIVKPSFTNTTNMTLKNMTFTENATVSPTIIPVGPTVNRPAPAQRPVSTPTVTPTYTPTPWGPVPPMSPATAMPPLSWGSQPLFYQV